MFSAEFFTSVSIIMPAYFSDAPIFSNTKSLKWRQKNKILFPLFIRNNKVQFMSEENIAPTAPESAKTVLPEAPKTVLPEAPKTVLPEAPKTVLPEAPKAAAPAAPAAAAAASVSAPKVSVAPQTVRAQARPQTNFAAAEPKPQQAGVFDLAFDFAAAAVCVAFAILIILDA